MTGAAPRLLDPSGQQTVDRLHAKAKAQFPALIRHFLPRLPAFLMGRSVTVGDTRFFDDKLMPVDAPQGHLLYLLAYAKRARCAIEFGTSFGVSTIYLASAIRDSGAGGRVIGTEMVAAKAAQARANLAAAHLDSYAEIREGDARETLKGLNEPVDLLLLDGWPALANDILRIVEPHLERGALVVVDNVAQFRGDLQPVVDRVSRPPYRSTELPINGATLIAVYDGT